MPLYVSSIIVSFLQEFLRSGSVTAPTPKSSQRTPKAGLDGQNRAIVLAESLARVVAMIRITSVRWWSYLPKQQKLVLIDPAFVVLRFRLRNSRSLVQHPFHVELRNGLRKLTEFVATPSDWRLAIQPI